jgi:hypothetical protein
MTESGFILRTETIVEANAGGQYGWWGTSFAWSSDGRKMAYARADSIGVVDVIEATIEPLYELIPYQTLGDWAWVPPIAWGPKDTTLFFVDHARTVDVENAEFSQIFDLSALSPYHSLPIPIAQQTGMFAHLSPSQPSLSASGEESYRIAFLRAIFPLESETSRYRLVLMDRDGSNAEEFFPAFGEMGMEPGRISWSPLGDQIALIYRNDLWIINPSTGAEQQITSDGQTINFDWNPD